MKENLEHCLDLIFASERGYSDHPDDPGGPTMDGITIKTLSAWRKAPVSVEELRLLKSDERNAILTAQYADTIRFNDLPVGLDYCVLDCSVNSGPNRAGRMLQEILGMTGRDIDGVIGAHTLDVLTGKRYVSDQINLYCEARLKFMKSLKNWRSFKNGWTKRVERVQVEALRLSSGLPINLAVREDLPQDANAKATGATKMIRIPSGQATIATAGTVAATAATAITQATDILQPFANVGLIRNILLGLAVISAAAGVVVTFTRTQAGATT